MALERDAVAAEIDGVIAWLKEERAAAGVGCIGVCMGGGLTLATAIRPTSHVDAVHVFYGGGMPSEEAIARIRAPVMGSYGSLDEGIPAEQVDLLRATLEANGVANDVKLYEGAHHGFFNDTRDVYQAEASADAWRRTLGRRFQVINAPSAVSSASGAEHGGGMGWCVDEERMVG